MKTLKNILKFSACFALAMVFFSKTANAYIDPSAMTYIVQLVVGIVVAGGAAFAFTFRKIKRKLTHKKDEEPGEARQAGDTQEAYEPDEFDDEDFDPEEEI